VCDKILRSDGLIFINTLLQRGDCALSLWFEPLQRFPTCARHAIALKTAEAVNLPENPPLSTSLKSANRYLLGLTLWTL
jgi:hypothetical protein